MHLSFIMGTKVLQMLLPSQSEYGNSKMDNSSILGIHTTTTYFYTVLVRAQMIQVVTET